MFKDIEDLIIHSSDDDLDLATNMQEHGSNEMKAEVEVPPPSSGLFLNEGVRKKLKKLIKQYPDGLWCNDLPKAYIKNYNYVLDYKEFGCTSIIHFLSQIPDIIRCERPGDGDWLLFDASAPKSSIKNPHHWSSCGISQSTNEINHGTLKYKIHHGRSIKLGHDIYPSDVVRHEETWVNIDLNAQILKDSQLSIGVGEVWSPHKFYIHLQKFSNFLENFMSDLQDFYNVQHEKYKMTEAAIQPKQICVGYYSSSLLMMKEEWHRAEILAVLSDQSVSVYMVDFGSVATLKKSRLRFLHKGFLGFPAQAIPAKLVGIAPPKNRTTWPTSTCATFLELTRAPNFKARVVSIDENFTNKINVLHQVVDCRKSQNRLGIILYNTSSSDGISINKKLVIDNLAVMSGDILSKNVFPVNNVMAEEEQAEEEVVNNNNPLNSPVKMQKEEQDEKNATLCKVLKRSFRYFMKDTANQQKPKEKIEEGEQEQKQKDDDDDINEEQEKREEEEQKNQTLEDDCKGKEEQEVKEQQNEISLDEIKVKEKKEEVEKQQNQIPQDEDKMKEEEKKQQKNEKNEEQLRYEENRGEMQSRIEGVGENEDKGQRESKEKEQKKMEEEEEFTYSSTISKASNDYSSDVEEVYDKVEVRRPKTPKIRNKTHSAFSPRWNSSYKNANEQNTEKNEKVPPGINISASIPNLPFLCGLILEEEKLQRKKYLLALELLSKNDDLQEVAVFNPILALKLSLQMVACLNKAGVAPSPESYLSTSDFESELRLLGLDGVSQENVKSEVPVKSHYYPVAGSFPSSVSSQSIYSVSDRCEAETRSSSF